MCALAKSVRSRGWYSQRREAGTVRRGKSRGQLDRKFDLAVAHRKDCTSGKSDRHSRVGWRCSPCFLYLCMDLCS